MRSPVQSVINKSLKANSEIVAIIISFLMITVADQQTCQGQESPVLALRKLNLKKSLTLKVKRVFAEAGLHCSQKLAGEEKPRMRRKTFSCLQDARALQDVRADLDFKDLFQIKNKIGEGGQASVYACEERATKKKYAVKVLKLSSGQFSSARETYRIMSKLSHQCIVRPKLLFINQKSKCLHLVQELCQYPTLGDYLRQNGKVEGSRGSRILEQLLGAVAYMHSMGVCHRDIKPDNIMYCPETQELRLVDFEIARMLKYSNQQFELYTKTGTPNYRAPETFKAVYSEKVDVWAIGVIAYQIFTGLLPFENPFEAKLIRQITLDQPCLSGLTVEQKGLIEGLLSKDPASRLTAYDSLNAVYFLKNWDLKWKKPHSPLSPSQDWETFELSRRHPNLLKNRFYDDNVAEMFLGGGESEKVMRVSDVSTDEDESW